MPGPLPGDFPLSQFSESLLLAQRLLHLLHCFVKLGSCIAILHSASVARWSGPFDCTQELLLIVKLCTTSILVHYFILLMSNEGKQSSFKRSLNCITKQLLFSQSGTSGTRTCLLRERQPLPHDKVFAFPSSATIKSFD